MWSDPDGKILKKIYKALASVKEEQVMFLEEMLLKNFVETIRLI